MLEKATYSPQNYMHVAFVRIKKVLFLPKVMPLLSPQNLRHFPRIFHLYSEVYFDFTPAPSSFYDYSQTGHILEAAGTSYGNVVKTTVLLKSMEDFGKVNDVSCELKQILHFGLVV